VKQAALHTLEKGASPLSLKPVSDKLTLGVSYAQLDRACQKCHVNYSLHKPSESAMALSDFRKHLSIVRTGACIDCHREHVGKGPMNLPTDAACAACHASAQRMADNATKVVLEGAKASPKAELQKLTDGLVHFIPPETVRSRETLFKSFEESHPRFEYEDRNLRDPDVLLFNHHRHEAADIPKVDGRKLDCVYCHKASSPDFYQPVTYENSCRVCHSLQFDPRNPELSIPHGDPQRVRDFLHSLSFQYATLAQQKGFTKPGDIRAFVSRQLFQIKDQVRSGEEFEKQILFTANPYKSQPGTKAYFPGCAYCHEVKKSPNGDASPIITKPVMADRWLNHGRFTHSKHTGIACNDCHHASASTDTADILMPSKESCAQCHRASKGVTTALETSGDSTKTPDQLAVEKQRRDGGVASECLVCHTFHSPSPVYGMLKKLPEANAVLAKETAP
jgi:hypothetical protein